MTGECKSCGKRADLREGHCWECAEAESIIADGTDMYDTGMVFGEEERPAKSPMEKLLFLIKKGWHK